MPVGNGKITVWPSATLDADRETVVIETRELKGDLPERLKVALEAAGFAVRLQGPRYR